MRKRTALNGRVVFAGAVAVVATYGCERQNPYKLNGDGTPSYLECPTPTTGGGAKITSGGNGENVTDGGGPSSGNTMPSGSTGSGNLPPEQTELDHRELDYAEALRTASILLVGDAPTLAQIEDLAGTPADEQQAKYESMIDGMLADKRFAQTLIDYYRYTFKMTGSSVLAENPSRETAPVFAARIVYEEKDWRTLFLQQSATCPTYDPVAGTFSDGECLVPECVPAVTRGPAVENTVNKDLAPNEGDFVKPRMCRYERVNKNVQNSPWVVQFTQSPTKFIKSVPDGKHAGILSNPGILSLYWGNLAFRRNRFLHETFLCKSANEQAGGEPTPNAPQAPPCAGDNPIPGYQNKWPVNVIAGKCNGGRIDFHTYTNGNVCANCHATWNHRAPLLGQYDSQGILTPGVYQVGVPIDGSPPAMLSDWLCVGPSCPNGGMNGTAWKMDMPAKDVYELGKVMSDDPEVLDCAVKRMWNYAMGRADITEIGGRSWVTLPDRKDKNPDLLTQSKLAQYFKDSNYNLKKVLRKILVSDDFTRF